MEIADLEQTYLDKVFKLLYDMKQGESYFIYDTSNVAIENREKFTDAVKLYIHCEYDHFYGFVIEFSNDMKRVRKNGVYL